MLPSVLPDRRGGPRRSSGKMRFALRNDRIRCYQSPCVLNPAEEAGAHDPKPQPPLCRMPLQQRPLQTMRRTELAGETEIDIAAIMRWSRDGGSELVVEGCAESKYLRSRRKSEVGFQSVAAAGDGGGCEIDLLVPVEQLRSDGDVTYPSSRPFFSFAGSFSASAHNRTHRI